MGGGKPVARDTCCVSPFGPIFSHLSPLLRGFSNDLARLLISRVRKQSHTGIIFPEQLVAKVSGELVADKTEALSPNC